MKKLGMVKKKDLLKLEEKKKEYDIPPQMVEEFRKTFPTDGIKAMELIHQLSERFGDRTFEMVKRVSEKTGINFPHLFQSYVEFLLILAMGVEKYRMKESTTRRLFIDVPSCPLYEKWCEECEKALKKAEEFCKIQTKLTLQKSSQKCSLIFEFVRDEKEIKKFKNEEL